MDHGVPRNSGLKPLSWDPRDKAFSHSRLFGSVPLSQLPANGLGRIPLSVKNQGTTLFCTGYGTAAASEYQEGIELSAEFQTAMVGRMAGEPILGGADPRDALKALVAFGSLPQHLSPYSLDRERPDFIADWRNWPADLLEKAKPYGKAAYVRVDGPYDTFDSIRMALFMGDASKQAVIAFGRWYRGWNNVGTHGIIPDDQSALHGYHCYLFIDWIVIDGVEYLVAQNSYGAGFGKGGLQYFSRKVVNEAWKPDSLWGDGTGLFILRDISPGAIEAQKHTLLFIIGDILLKIANALKGVKPPIPPPAPQPAPAPVPAPQTPPAPVKRDLIRLWAEEIERQEGGQPEHLNTRLKNPGNLKVSSYTRSLGCIPASNATDGGTFCRFASYEEGLDALCQLLRDACTNQLRAYRSTMTLLEFTNVYARPPTAAYAEAVAKALSVSVTTTIGAIYEASA